MYSKSILLIDDNDVDNFILEKFVAQSTANVKIYSCLTAESALGFLSESLKTSKVPDMILLDLNMPGIGGWGFLKEFLKLNIHKDVALFLLTGSIYPGDKEESKQYPEVNGFLIKPLAREKLLELIEKFL